MADDRAFGPLGPGDERDACALLGWISRSGKSERAGVRTVLGALGTVRHRAGFTRGECDGAGLMVDLPRALWADLLEAAGHLPHLAYHPDFTLAHVFADPADERPAVRRLTVLAEEASYQVLAVRESPVHPEALGPLGRSEAPLLLQGAFLPRQSALVPPLADLTAQVARDGMDVVSWSSSSAVYKVRGDAQALGAYYEDLADPRLTTAFAMGHLRFSTNTQSVFGRVQPFGLLGHNGEINTIARLREEARALGFDLVAGASDSQDLDRFLQFLLDRMGLSLIEAMTLVFPPVPERLARLDEEERRVLTAGRDALGPIAQGPAAIVARAGDEVVCSLDALGLRPLWLVPAQDAWWVTSERTIVPFDQLVGEPRPLAPGEKVAFRLHPGHAPELFEDAALRAEAAARLAERGLGAARPTIPPSPPPSPLGLPLGGAEALPGLFGWDQEDVEICRIMADEARDPIGSLGYDGPLAALAEERRQVSDFLHETVAVVTNPAIDREREGEHFSTDAWLGARPPIPGEGRRPGPFVRLGRPLVLEPVPVGALGEAGAALTAVARAAGLALLGELSLPSQTLSLALPRGTSLPEALEAIGQGARRAVREGAALLVLDDGLAFEQGMAPIDPLLALGAVGRALDGTLRRRTGILVRSAGVRRLHDVCALLALGADAVDPYLLWLVAARGAKGDPGQAVASLARVLCEGVEKVMSTMGIHELRGYARVLSSLGLADEVVPLLRVPAYLAAGSGHNLARFEAEARARAAEAEAVRAGEKLPPARVYHLYPKIWKAALEVASGQRPYAEYEAALADLEARRPISLRHLLDVAPSPARPPVPAATAAVGEHRFPLVVSSMSFGSQGETAYRAYLEGAARAGVLCLNGEGGEFQDLIGRYGPHRGIQVASGRFGIAGPLVASARYLEIKIGQGAKPGEGGHLPARKVSAKVARARNAQTGVDLISPSNNHDLYSIEDLAELIDELREASPDARIIVKVPVVPGIGTIAVGIAKAGADVVTLSGFDGGTGACRRHSARHVGLPAEIGLYEAHRALLESGLRAGVELWCDGGMKSALDVVKCMLLGANRVAFGTLAMVSVGCTICRACQADTCHVGITTQVESEEEALAKGFKRFVPRHPEIAAGQLARMLEAIGTAVEVCAASLGYASSQELVGHAEHLVQARGRERLDLSPLLASLPLPAARPEEALDGDADAADAAPTATRVSDLVAGAPSVRMVGTAIAGELVRQAALLTPERQVRLEASGVVGQGLAVFQTGHLDTIVLGGAQDGVAKGALGGRVAVLKARAGDGAWRDGSVGKSFAYGAQGGRLFVQGDADSRAAVRLSGGGLVFGGRPHGPLDGTAERANLKGFAFEYMTGGVAVCLGDPGPWLGAGMTGGTVYVLLWPELGLDLDALRGRLARGASCVVDRSLGAADQARIADLLGEYGDLLDASGQEPEASWVRSLVADGCAAFARIRPKSAQVAQDVSTE